MKITDFNNSFPSRISLSWMNASVSSAHLCFPASVVVLKHLWS